MITPKRYGFYKAKINYHKTDDLRVGVLPNNSIIHVEYLWTADEKDRFTGDMIFQPAESPHWLPQRDLIFLEEITHEEFFRHER